MLKMSCFLRLAQVETVQFFQFNSDGNMFMFPPGTGCTGIPKLVKPGDEMTFSGDSSGFSQEVNENEISSSSVLDVTETKTQDHVTVSKCTFNGLLKSQDLKELKHKSFSEETLKKVKWAIKMYCDWCGNRLLEDEVINLNLDHKETVTIEGLNFTIPQFIT